MNFIEKLFNRRETQLAKAIENHDLHALKRCLDQGVKKIDYLQTVMGDHGEKIPAERFTDMWKMAEKMNLPQQGLAILYDAGIPDPNGYGKIALENIQRKQASSLRSPG